MKTFVLGSCLLLVAGPCADNFARSAFAELRCGDGIDDLKIAAAKHRAELKAARHPRLGNYVAIRGRDNAWFDVGPNGLEAIAFSRGFGLMGTRESARRNLCTGQLTVGLTVETGEEFEGAEVTLDGSDVGVIGKWRFLEVRVPLGTHVLRLEKAGQHVFEKRLAFSESTNGNPRLSVPAGEIRE